MKVNLILQARIKMRDGIKKLAFLRPDFFRQQCNQFTNKDDLEVIIRKKKIKRSGGQNKYWHGPCFGVLSDLIGCSEAEAKKICVNMFILPYIVKVGNKEIELRKGTSDLSKDEGWKFTENIRQLAAELGGYIPTPCEAGYYCGRSDCEVCNKDVPEIKYEEAEEVTAF